MRSSETLSCHSALVKSRACSCFPWSDLARPSLPWQLAHLLLKTEDASNALAEDALTLRDFAPPIIKTAPEIPRTATDIIKCLNPCFTWSTSADFSECHPNFYIELLYRNRDCLSCQ